LGVDDVLILSQKKSFLKNCAFLLYYTTNNKSPLIVELKGGLQKKRNPQLCITSRLDCVLESFFILETAY